MRAFKRAMAAAFVASILIAPAASADPGNPQDDKNNLTAPGQMQGPAWENRNEHCSAHWHGEMGGGSTRLPAQCQTTVAR